MAELASAFKLKAEVTLKINGQLNAEIRKEVKRRLSIGAKRIATTARRLAPYDPNSRIARGKSKQNFPKQHHRASIRTESGPSKSMGVGVRTISGRFYFIEFPTRTGGRRSWGKTQWGKRKRGHGATKRVGSGVSMRTPGQPHFWPAVAIHYEEIYDSLEGLI
jgi:hypothetical protein